MTTTLCSNRTASLLVKRPLLTAMMTAFIASVGLAGCSSPDSSDNEITETKAENQTADAASNVAENDNVSVATSQLIR